MNRWERVQELFVETAALAGEERARGLEILRERAQGDAELVRAVEALLAAEATPLEVLDGTAGDLWRAMLDEPDPELLCGAGFGPYRVEEHLSSGGMGHVYRATRASAGTERRVALKVLRSGLDQSAFLAWFQRERWPRSSMSTSCRSSTPARCRTDGRTS